MTRENRTSDPCITTPPRREDVPLFLELGELLARLEAADESLYVRDDAVEHVVTQLLHVSEHSRAEEHLRSPGQRSGKGHDKVTV